MTILFPFAPGSVSPSDVTLASEARGHDVVFIVDPSDVESRGYLRVISAFGEVLLLDDDEACEYNYSTTTAGIVAFADNRLPLAYALARRFGLPGNDPEVAALTTYKTAQRNALNAAGVGFCPTVALRAGCDLPADLGPYLPGVLKPSQGAGSRDTHLVDSAAEVDTQLRAGPPGERYVLEARLTGPGRAPGSTWLADYLSVESYVVNGQVTHLGITGRLPLAAPAREQGLVFPFSMSNELDDEARRVAERAIDALGISHGFTHTELKYVGTGFVPIEVNARLGGGLALLMPRARVVDPVGMAIDLALGRETETPALACGVAAHVYVQAALSAVTYIRGPQPRDLRLLTGVFRADSRRAAGSALDWREGSSGRIFDLWLEATDLAELKFRLDGLDRFLADTMFFEHEGVLHGHDAG